MNVEEYPISRLVDKWKRLAIVIVAMPSSLGVLIVFLLIENKLIRPYLSNYILNSLQI